MSETQIKYILKMCNMINEDTASLLSLALRILGS